MDFNIFLFKGEGALPEVLKLRYLFLMLGENFEDFLQLTDQVYFYHQGGVNELDTFFVPDP